MIPQPDRTPPPTSETSDLDVSISRATLLWGAGPALACGFWVYVLWPHIFELSLGWGGIRTLLLVGVSSMLQFGCAALPHPGVRKVLGGAGWLGAISALIFLIDTRY